VANPKFLNVIKNKLNIGNDSAAKGNANPLFAIDTEDILGIQRLSPYDMGAYNYSIFEED
jgi:hypothetical protein